MTPVQPLISVKLENSIHEEIDDKSDIDEKPATTRKAS